MTGIINVNDNGSNGNGNDNVKDKCNDIIERSIENMSLEELKAENARLLEINKSSGTVIEGIRKIIDHYEEKNTNSFLKIISELKEQKVAMACEMEEEEECRINTLQRAVNSLEEENESLKKQLADVEGNYERIESVLQRERENIFKSRTLDSSQVSILRDISCSQVKESLKNRDQTDLAALATAASDFDKIDILTRKVSFLQDILQNLLKRDIVLESILSRLQSSMEILDESNFNMTMYFSSHRRNSMSNPRRGKNLYFV